MVARNTTSKVRQEIMETIRLTDIPVTFRLRSLAKRLHERENSMGELEALVEQAQAVARPKATLGLAYVDERDDDTVTLDGITFKSRVLQVNMKATNRAFCYVATCGRELYDWAESLDDVLLHFWAEAIEEAALRDAMRAVNGEIKRRFSPGKLVTMSPGSLIDWPITQQRPFFRLMGDPTEAIGVELKESCLMIPNKSVSGVRFEKEERFESCQLCPRRDCPNRRMPYDAELYEKQYAAG